MKNEERDLVIKFVDGTELSREEIVFMQDNSLICTEGKGHQYALTEYGRGFLRPASLYDKNRERTLINGRPAVDAKDAIYRYIHGLEINADQRQELLAQEYIEPNERGGTVITPKGEALFKAGMPTGSFVTVTEQELKKIVTNSIAPPGDSASCPDEDANWPQPSVLTKAHNEAQDLQNALIRGALDKQVAGSHYKDHAIQPIEYIHANKLGFIEGNVVKYITRHASKGGAEDVRKVIHYCELLLQLEYAQ